MPFLRHVWTAFKWDVHQEELAHANARQRKEAQKSAEFAELEQEIGAMRTERDRMEEITMNTQEPGEPREPEFIKDSIMVDRGMASTDATQAFSELQAKRMAEISKSGGRDRILDEMAEEDMKQLKSGKKVKKKTPKFVHSIKQLGDAVGIKDVGRNFIVNVGLGDPQYWCQDPRKPWLNQPLPINQHPMVQLAFNSRYINVHLEDKGTVDKPTETVLWDADFGNRKSVKEISSKMVPEGGSHPQMDLICPKAGTSHRLELNVSGKDHRKDPPRLKNRGLDETVMFEAEILPPGAKAAQRGPPGAGPNFGSGAGGFGEGAAPGAPGSLTLRRGPFVESAPSPLLAALLPPPGVASRSQQQQRRLAVQQRLQRVAAFL